MKTGERHGRLVCIGKDTTRDNRYYLFKCDCGNVKSIIAHNVQRGATKSCGCICKEHPSHTIYGYSHTRIDNIYKSMIDRCENPKSYNYYKYGAKGIRVCKEWKEDKMSFFAWAFETGYADNLSIDRIDNSKGYSPNNCRWVTTKEQANNKTNNRIISAFGMKKTLAQWADYSGIPYNTLWARLRSGWVIERALTEEVRANAST